MVTENLSPIEVKIITFEEMDQHQWIDANTNQEWDQKHDIKWDDLRLKNKEHQRIWRVLTDEESVSLAIHNHIKVGCFMIDNVDFVNSLRAD